MGGDWGIRALVIAPDNQTLISGNQDRTLRIWDLSSKSIQQTLNIPSGEIESLAVSPNNQTLVVGTSTGAVQLLDYKQGTLQKILSPPHSGKVQAIATSPDGQTLFTGSWNDRFVRVWDLRRRQLLSTLSTNTEVLSLAMSPDGQTFYVGTLGTIEIWDVNRQQLVRLFSAHSREVQVLVASSDGRLLVSGGIDQVDLSQIWTLKVWDTQSLELLATLKGYSSSLESLAINPDGKAVIFNDCCKASFWNWTNNKLVSDIDGMNHNTVLSPDGKTLVSVGSDRETMTVKALDTILQSSNTH